MNVGGMVDSTWFAKDDAVNAVLMAWQGGMEGGLATADLLVGDAVPSGKLVDTFAQRLEDYPSSYNFHESQTHVEYTDDIYVGYRYFETIPGAAGKVNYPFGFGLSYTSFLVEVKQAEAAAEGAEALVTVTNTGDYAGKEVVQLYVSAPQGRLADRAGSLFQSAHSCFKNICSCEKSKKTGTPSNNPVRPKSLNLHTACMHVSAFVSVCFVCGIPDDALSYIFCMTVKFNPALCVTECRSLVCELLFVYSPEYISELLFCQDNFLILFFYRIRQRSGSL